MPKTKGFDNVRLRKSAYSDLFIPITRTNVATIFTRSLRIEGK